VDTQSSEFLISCDGPLDTPVWSPDGKSIYYKRKRGGIAKLDYGSLRTNDIFSGKSGSPGLAISPDGGHLVFYEGENSIVLLPPSGGEPGEIVHFEKEERINLYTFLNWTPDGEYLLFKRRHDLWMIHVNTRKEMKVGSRIAGLSNAVLHPDGRCLVFTSGQSGSQLWVMKNFLPEKGR